MVSSNCATNPEFQNSQIQLRFTIIPGQFAVCRLDPEATIPDWAVSPSNLMVIARTSDELSIVCLADNVPFATKAERGWLCLQLIGPFPFSMTGVLASFIAPLAANHVSIFAIATFDTDYVLVKEESRELALSSLQAAGHQFTAASS
jgi:hypothetical protein